MSKLLIISSLCVVLIHFTSGSPTGYGTSSSASFERDRIVFADDPVLITSKIRSKRRNNNNNSNKNNDCPLVNKVVYDVEYEEINDQVCKTVQERVCNTRNIDKCENYQENVCNTKQNKQCTNKQERKCEDYFRTVSETYTQDECTDEVLTECEKAWQVSDDGAKIWADDPATCHEVRKTKCSPVSKQRSRQVPDQKCETVNVPVCRNIPKQECRAVTRQRCEKVPIEECNNVPKERCQKVHKKVPKQVTKEIQVRECSQVNEVKVNNGNNDKGDDVVVVEDNADDILKNLIRPRFGIQQ